MLRVVRMSMTLVVLLGIICIPLGTYATDHHNPLGILTETEPNDTIAQANLIGIGYNQGHENSTLSSTTDVDYYKFTTTANRTYVIETYNIAGSGTRATGLRLYNSSGTELTDDQYGNNGSGVTNARITFKFVTAGTYYIKVARATFQSWTGTYSIRVLAKHGEPSASWDSANDFEPNDRPEIANEISIGLTNAVTRELFSTNGFVTAASDQDYYYFTATAGRTYVIETFNIAGTNSRATGLWLYNNLGTEIDNDEYGNNGSGQANARLVFKAITGGTYYIRVARATFESWTGTYSLRVLPRFDELGAAWDATNDYEPNDTLALANSLNVASSLTRTLFDNENLVSATTDQDYYYFTAQANVTYMIQTFNVQLASNGRATGIYLYNDSSTLLDDDQYGNNGTGSNNAQITFTPTTAGNYFIKVRRAEFTPWTGTYSIRVCAEDCQKRVYIPMVRR